MSVTRVRQGVDPTAAHTKIYSQNAAAISVEEGDDILIRDCVLRDAGYGLFSSAAYSRLNLSGNHIYDNGIDSTDVVGM